MKGYFVCRAVNRPDGTTAAPVESRDTYEDAEALFYTRCGQARNAVNSGESLSDCVVFFEANGNICESKGWVAPTNQDSAE